jgi:hypothetical protein
MSESNEGQNMILTRHSQGTGRLRLLQELEIEDIERNLVASQIILTESGRIKP